METKTELSEYLHKIKNHPDFGPAYVYHRYLTPLEPKFGPTPRIHPNLSEILKKKKCYETEIHFLNEAKIGNTVKSNTKILTENEKTIANHEIIREDGKLIARIKTIWK